MFMAKSNGAERKRKEWYTAQIQRVNGLYIQIAFTYQGNRYRVPFGKGWEDTQGKRPIAAAQKAAKRIASMIENDIAEERVDTTLSKYKRQASLKVVESAPEASEICLTDLWQKYFEYASVGKSIKTIESTYKPVTAHLSKCQTNGLKEPDKFRLGLLQVTTESQARRTLMQLSAAANWGVKRGLISTNPFNGMYKTLEATQAPPPKAFTVEQRNRIIEAFKNDTRKGMNYRHYAPLVKFLFWTGCRPCEAAGLRWGSVTPDCSKVLFHESIVDVSGRLIRQKETKTKVKRWFSCDARLQTLLLSVKPENPDPEALVFLSPEGNLISITNFSQRGWEKVLTELGLHVIDGIKMTVYNCRDTFITLQATPREDSEGNIIPGHSSTTIGRWVGNSSEVIEKKYLDKLQIEAIRPASI